MFFQIQSCFIRLAVLQKRLTLKAIGVRIIGIEPIGAATLYESLLDTSRELNMTIKDFKRLVEQWEQEGVSFKLK